MQDTEWSRRARAMFATVIGVLGVATLVVDFSRSLIQSMAVGQSMTEAAFAYVRFFTILTNGGVAALMIVTAAALWRHRAPPSASVYRAATVYMIVTCAAYEILLRHLWSPQGVQFASDVMFHDVQPGLTVLFWVFCAPKDTLRWITLPWLLLYPAAYFAITLVAGALGAGYPYDFLDAAMLGYRAVFMIALAFLGVFLGLGAIATAAARIVTDDRSAAVSRRSSSYR